METYIHKVQYYETDRMGFVHHSNHIRWMEEARICFFEQIGLPYQELEARGLFSPVLEIECAYKAPAVFGDSIAVEIRAEAYQGVSLSFGYTMTKTGTGELVLTGRTKHCFIDADGRLLIPKKRCPEIDEKLKNLVRKE